MPFPTLGSDSKAGCGGGILEEERRGVGGYLGRGGGGGR